MCCIGAGRVDSASRLRMFRLVAMRPKADAMDSTLNSE
jgi:hypothetical protein